MPDAPAVLHVRGALPRPSEGAPTVAIVGSRAASGWGMEAAERLGEAIAVAGGVVVSGGALGIDAAAHRGALAGGGATVAVLAAGLDHLYPARNRRLFAAIADTGALVTPYQLGTPVRRWQFVRRNRIIAGLADIVVVLEATVSSGSLYTAAAARDYGRLLGAMPGSPGCEALIAQGAAVVADGADLRAALAGRPRRPEVHLPSQSSEGARVLAALDELGHDPHALSRTTGLPIRAVTRALAELELDGLALLLPGQLYARSQLAASLIAGEVAR